MSCLKHSKKCEEILCYKKENSFICAGVAKKGTKYYRDVIWLCTKSKFGKVKMEIAPEEVAYFCSALNAALADVIVKLEKENYEKTHKQSKKGKS